MLCENTSETKSEISTSNLSNKTIIKLKVDTAKNTEISTAKEYICYYIVKNITSCLFFYSIHKSLKQGCASKSFNC